MRTRNHSKRLIFIFILACTLGVFLTYIGIDLYSTYKTDYPAQPSSFGDFPHIPAWILDAGETIITTPVIGKPISILQTNKSVIGFDVLSGKILWNSDSYNDNDLSIEPVISNGKVFVAENDSAIAAFSLINGDLLWRHTPDMGDLALGNVIGTIQGLSSDSSLIFVIRHSWMLSAYDQNTGSIVWQVDLPSRASPFIFAGNNSVYLSVGNFLAVYNAEDGSLINRVYFPGTTGPVLIEGEKLFLTVYSNGTSIYILDKNTLDGKSISIEDEVRCLRTHNNWLIAAGAKLTVVSEETGTMLWETGDIGPLECPVFISDMIYVRNKLSRLFSIDLSDGEITGWLHIRMNSSNNSDPARSPVSIDNLLIVPFGDDRVFAFRP